MSMNDTISPSRRFVLVLGLLSGLVAFAIDISLPAIPSLVHALATDMSHGQQVVGVFMAGMAIGQLPAGLVSDRIGRLPVLYAGMGLFTVAGIVTAISGNIETLLVARFIQGMGSSAGMVLARAIVRDVASGRQAARLLSIMVMIFTAAPMLAPLVGSYLVDQWGWRQPFWATALAGALIIIGIRTSLRETHAPQSNVRTGNQLLTGLQRVFSHRRSRFGLLIVVTTVTGIMSLVTGSAALVIEVFDYPVRYFGLIFALTGIAILAGSWVNRRLLQRFDPISMIGIGAGFAGLAAIGLLATLFFGDGSFWWIWSNACLYMFATAFLMPNATAIALDPMPDIAGAAASIIGTMQSFAAALSAIIGSALYTGTPKNIVYVLSAAGVMLTLLFLLRKKILGSKDIATIEAG